MEELCGTGRENYLYIITCQWVKVLPTLLWGPWGNLIRYLINAQGTPTPWQLTKPLPLGHCAWHTQPSSAEETQLFLQMIAIPGKPGFRREA